jgi:hypothetical protein
MRPLPGFGAVSSSQRFRRANSTLMSLLGTPDKKPAPPKPSASLVIVNGKNEVLLIHRNPNIKSFGGVHVSKLSVFLRAIFLSFRVTFRSFRGETMMRNKMILFRQPLFGKHSKRLVC